MSMLQLLNETDMRRLKFLAALYAAFKTFRYIRSLMRCRITGRAVLITGCDSGFGLGATKRLAASSDNVTVYAGCLTPVGVAQLEALNDSRIRPVLMDVTSEASVAAAYEHVRARCAADSMLLHAVVNNAGVLRTGPVDCLSLEDWQVQYNVNVIGTWLTTRAFLPLLRISRGRVVNIASIAGFIATPDTSSYNASKFAVEGLSDSLRRELARWGITVIVIEPGIMKTPLWDNVLSESELLRQQFDRCSDDVQALYGKEFVIAKHRAYIDLVSLVNGNPAQIVNGIQHAVRCRYPHARYTIGWDTPIFRFISWLPTCVADWVIDAQTQWLMHGILPAAQRKK